MQGHAGHEGNQEGEQGGDGNGDAFEPRFHAGKSNRPPGATGESAAGGRAGASGHAEGTRGIAAIRARCRRVFRVSHSPSYGAVRRLPTGGHPKKNRYFFPESCARVSAGPTTT